MTATAFTCNCCDQAWPGPDIPDYIFPFYLFPPPKPEVCVTCEGHQDNILKLESEHAAEFRRRLVDANEALTASVSERREVKRRILNLEPDLDRALDALNRATLFHKRLVPAKDCMCGQPHCETCTVGPDYWVYDQIQARKRRRSRGA